MAIDCLESPVFIFIDWKIEFYDTIVQRFLNHLVIALLSFTRDYIRDPEEMASTNYTYHNDSSRRKTRLCVITRSSLSSLCNARQPAYNPLTEPVSLILVIFKVKPGKKTIYVFGHVKLH